MRSPSRISRVTNLWQAYSICSATSPDGSATCPLPIRRHYRDRELSAWQATTSCRPSGWPTDHQEYPYYSPTLSRLASAVCLLPFRPPGLSPVGSFLCIECPTSSRSSWVERVRVEASLPCRYVRDRPKKQLISSPFFFGGSPAAADGSPSLPVTRLPQTLRS